MSDRVYWLVSKKSPVMKVITEALAIQNTFGDAMKALKAEFGAKDVWTWDNAVFSGLAFDAVVAPVPGLWRKAKDKWVADYRTKQGRLLRTRLENLPRGVTPRSFSAMLHNALNIEFEHFGDHMISWTVCEKLGDVQVLSVPAGLKIEAIPGCKELKMSEYWKLKEKAGK